MEGYETSYPCYCNVCDRNNSGVKYSYITKRTRKAHEERDPNALQNRLQSQVVPSIVVPKNAMTVNNNDLPVENYSCLVEDEEMMEGTFAKRVSSYGGRVLETCDEQLYIQKGNNALIPKAHYMYSSVIETLKKFYMRDGFAEAVIAWKKRKLIHPDYVFDCYDAHVFKNFKLKPTDSQPFVEQSDHNLLFSFNVDWFQQFKNSPYSCGANYLTCLNLPRSIRNLRENIIFVGLMRSLVCFV